jgi:hypothetical protein
VDVDCHTVLRRNLVGRLIDRLVGLRVQVEIEEDGTDNPPDFPPGTIVRRLVAADGNDYYLVHLDHPVQSIRATTGKSWQLSDVTIATRFTGDRMDRLLSKLRNPFVHVGIANFLSAPSPDDPTLDFSKVEYFGIGTVRRA